MGPALAVLVLLLSGSSPGQSITGESQSIGDAIGGRGLASTRKGAEFTLLMDGAGQPSFPTNAVFFASNAAEFVGDWWGFDGSTGLAVSGSHYMFSAQGAPFAQSPATCNNGRDCALTTSRRLDVDADFYQAAANAAAPPGDFSVCLVGSNDKASAAGSSTDLVTLWDDDTAAQRSVYFHLDENSKLVLGVYNGTSTTELLSTSALPVRQEQVWCATYDWIASGSSVARLYVDGVLSSAVKSDMVGPANPTTLTPWIIGSRKDITTKHLEGRVRLAFVTGKLLSAATLLSMSNSLLGKGLAASTGAVMTLNTRASTITCTNDDWVTMTTIGVDTPCVTANGFDAIPPATNLLLWSDALDNAAWVDVGTPAGASADVAGVYTADGSPTADVTGDDSAAAFEGESQTVASTSQTKFTWSGWLRAGTIDKVTVRITGTGNAAGDTACTFTGLTATPMRKKCATAAAYGAGITAVMVEVLAGTVVADVGTFAVWGQQLETLGARTPYIRTESVAVARTFYQAGFDAPASMVEAQGCIRATFYAYDEQPNASANAVMTSNNGGKYLRVSPEIPTSVNMNDSTNSVSKTGLTSMIGRSVDMLATWSTGLVTVEETGIARAISLAYDGAVIGTAPAIRLGRSGNSSDPSFGRISNIRVGATPESCR